jgi:hypothetical protein
MFSVALRKWTETVVCVVAIAFCVALITVPQPASAEMGGCVAAAGPGGHCCACNEDVCIEVQHQGVRKCDGPGWCSQDECEWIT